MRQVISLAVLIGGMLAYGQPRASEAGVPFVRWFSPQEYNGSQQVWSFVQDLSLIHI